MGLVPARRAVAVVVGAALAVLGLASCAPPEPPVDPTNIVNMTDEQVETKLEEILPDAEAALADPGIVESIPAEYRDEVLRVVGDLRTSEGRDRLTDELRKDAATTRGGFAQAKEKFAGGLLDTVVAFPEELVADPDLHATRSPAPPTTGVSVPYESTSGACNAPGGTGTLAAPEGLVPDQLITPEHDVFAKFSNGTLGPVGENTINGTRGVEFRGLRSSWQMRVQVDVQDVNKGFPVRALYPIFHLRPIGGTAADEQQVFPVEGNIYCYADDGRGSNRGYFDGWIPIPPTEPGFQLIAEVIENDWYFRLGGEAFEPLLTQSGPQFFAGADRSTVHIGQDPVTRSGAITHSVGAFATISPDPGNGNPNAVTDTNGLPADDVEAAVAGMLESKVVGALSDQLDGVLSNYYAITVWGSNAVRPEADVDLRFVDPHTSFPDVADEPLGAVGALEALISGEGHADVGLQFLGTPCFGLTLDVSFNSTADIWADSAGFGTGILPRFKVDTEPETNLDMPWYDWLLTPCVLGFLIVAGKAPGSVEDGVNGALEDALGEGGTITKLMSGLDLDTYLPDLTIDPITIGNSSTGGAVIRPHIGNLDNAWCSASGAPPGCTNDQSLIGRNGVEVVADASLASNTVQPIGAPLFARFPNVFSPTVTTKLEDLVVSHRDTNGTAAGLGIVVDPRLINLALRALAQGPSFSTTTNGLADITDFALPISGFSVTTRPEVAPMVLGVTSPQGLNERPTAPVVAPDVRVELRTSDANPEPISYSVAAYTNIGLTFDAAARSVKPVFDSPIVDLQVTGGCQVNYESSYFLSYGFCGRGTGGNGGSGITSVTDLLDEIANSIVAPLVNNSIGSIGLPSLDGLVPGTHLALSNVRFADRGGHLAVYADIAPLPLIRLVGSSAGYGGEDDTIRFFAVPTNVNIGDPSASIAWSIKDKVTGQPVGFSYVPGTGKTAVQFPSNAFTPADNVDKRKTVQGSVTVDLGDIHVVGNGEFSWVPPQPVPPPNCPSAPGQFLKALPGGVGDYGSIGTVLC